MSFGLKKKKKKKKRKKKSSMVFQGTNIHQQGWRSLWRHVKVKPESVLSQHFEATLPPVGVGIT